MKKYQFLIILLLIAATCSAQETTTKKERLTESVDEVYHVLKTDKQTKEGLYQALLNGKTALASGLYTSNKRTGIWHFYDTGGQMIQNFNYDRQTVLYEEPTTELNRIKIGYAFDALLNDSDKVTKPIKPGGECFGYINYLRLYRVSPDMYDMDLSQFAAFLEVLVSPGGRLADIKVHIKSGYFERITTFSTELIDEPDKVFAPATINGQPVLCRIFVKCRLLPNGELDVF